MEWDTERLIGTVIAGRYRVDARLGAGAMGVVLRCHAIEQGYDVAVKLLHPDLCGQPNVAQRFDREARSAARLEHPNCVRVFDFGTARVGELPNARYLCMELFGGTELARLMTAPLELAFTHAVIGQLLDGLGHAHARGVVHRDVKPQNVLVAGSPPIVKLLDFGIAKVLADDAAIARITRRGQVCGTPSYMSPEQIVDGEVDGRADIYAVGVLLYRMLSGRLPFEAPDIASVMQMHVRDAPPALPSTVPATVRAVVSRLLAKQPDDRPRDAATARLELDAAFRAAQPVVQEPRPPRAVRAARAPAPRPASEPRASRLGPIIAWGLFGAAAVVFFLSPELGLTRSATREAAAGATSRSDVAHELREAATAPEPCAAMAAVLQRIDAGSGELPGLDDIRVPPAPADADDATREACARAAASLDEVRAQLRAAALR